MRRKVKTAIHMYPIDGLKPLDSLKDKRRQSWRNISIGIIKIFWDWIMESRSNPNSGLWTLRISDYTEDLATVKQASVNLESRIRSGNQSTQSSSPLPHHLPWMIFLSPFQRSSAIKLDTSYPIIKQRTRKAFSHLLSHSLLTSPLPHFHSSMSRHFERSMPKRNSALNLDPIVIDAFDNSDLLAAYDLTLVGRVLNTDLQAHRVKALLALMPQAWQLEGRVQGVEVGRGKFHFRFNTEEDLQGVLEKRPFFFDQWMFPLERWVPSVRTDFPSTMVFTVFIEGIPEHYHKEQTVKGIGEKLGELILWDVKQAKVRVSVECEKPLQFERRVQFSATGDEVVVYFKYDKLQKWCFICHRLNHDGKRCPDLEKERAHVSKHGYKDRNLRQQDVLRGELSPYEGQGKAPKYQTSKQQNFAKPPINRRLFADKEASPKPKLGGSSEKIAVETTKTWVVKSFGDKNVNHPKEAEKRIPRDPIDEIPKKGTFKPASWYREPISETARAVSDPGKTTSRRSKSNEKLPAKLALQGKAVVSACSQVLVNPTDVEEVISPLKELLYVKRPREGGDERGGRRGNIVKSRLGPRSDVALQAKKKIARSPYRNVNPRKRQAMPYEESPKKKVLDKRVQESSPPALLVGPANGKKKEDFKKLVVEEIPPANPI
ncbi:hypothetical protein N665_4145s0002 [Sinapis alba]|nr:hypothetical protein N665_4145s0002 [Sinapis alba]